MTRSIFDPANPDVERSGDRFTGPDANQISKMPPDVIDGVVEGANKGPDRVGFDAEGNPLPPPLPGAEDNNDDVDVPPAFRPA